LIDDSVTDAALTQPGEVGQLAREVLEDAAYTARQNALRKIRDDLARKAFGNGLKGAEKICQESLKKIGKEGLKELQEIAKTGMKKAAELAKNADNPRSWDAAVKAFEVQMLRSNAIRTALEALGQ
jgi:vacuolar-type H+-ATPase subunit H